MNIGLDIDQTMYHLDVVDRVSHLLGLNYKTEDVKHWMYDKQRINGFPKYFTDLVFAHFDKPDYMCKLKSYNGVYHKLLEWINARHKLYVISARKPSVQIETVQMLIKDFGSGFFESIHFVEHKTNAKENLFKELKLDIWIDDNPKDIENACHLGLMVYGINNKYTKYNDRMVLKCLQDFDNFEMVKGIKDINL